jgi:uridine kinase
MGLANMGVAQNRIESSCFLVGISGGSGSGKTTLSRIFQQRLGTHNCQLLGQDSYYLDQSDQFDEDGGKINFDHPSSIDFPLFIKHLKALKRGETIQVPHYDFATHKRLCDTSSMGPSQVILVDGILILTQPEILEELDCSIFIDIPTEIRFQRRLKRDVLERGRDEDGVRRQFLKQVQPMHEKFVDPTKCHAKYVMTDNLQAESVVNKVIEELLKV